MAGMVLTKTRFHAGIWEGVLTGAGVSPPSLVLRHGDEDVGALEVVPGDEAHLVRAKVPAERLADGVQTFTIAAVDAADVLASFAIVSDGSVEEDLRAEVDLLRAELDLLKRAFRKHCAE